jgi:hypothetical protein
VNALSADIPKSEVQIIDTNFDSAVEISEENNVIQEKPIIVDNTSSDVEEHQETPNIPVYDLYDIPTPTELQDMISSCITEKLQRNQKQWHMIQTTLDPQRVEILNQLNLDTTHHVTKDIYESLHNKYIRKIYYTADEYTTERRDTAMNSKNYPHIKEYLVAMYSIVDKFLTNAKKSNTYTRDIAREVIEDKKKISDLLGVQYNEIIDLSTDRVVQCEQNKLAEAVALMDEL